MGKNICIILLFDEVTRHRLQTLKESAYAFDVDFEHNYPHITIANYPGINPARIKRYAAKFFAEVNAFSVSLTNLIRLDAHVIAVEPGFSARLWDIYERFHTQFDELANVWTSASLNNFHPHVSLINGEETMLNQLFPHFNNVFIPFNGYINAVEVSEVLPTGFKILAHINLQA